MSHTWRRYNFFEKDTVRAPALSCLDIACGASGRGAIILGDGEGRLVFVDRDFRATAFQAYKTRVTHVVALKTADVLVTLGDGPDPRPAAVRAATRAAAQASRERLRRERDAEHAASGAASGSSSGEGGSAAGEGAGEGGAGSGADADIGYVLGLGVPLELASLTTEDAGGATPSSAAPSTAAGAAPSSYVLKVWRLDRRDPRTGAPECVKSVKLPALPGSAPGTDAPEPHATALAIAEDLSQAAVGTSTGAVLLALGDLAREARSLGGGLVGGGSGRGVKFVALSMGPGTAGDAVTFLSYVNNPDPAAASGGGSGSGARRSRAMLCLFAVTPNTARCFFPTEVRPWGMGRLGQGPSGGWAPSECSVLLEEGPGRGADFGCACISAADTASLAVAAASAGGSSGGSGGAVASAGGDLVLTNALGVFTYSFDDRKAAYTLPGTKLCAVQLRSTLVVAGLDERGRAALTVYDLRSKYVAFHVALTGPLGAAAAAAAAGAGGGRAGAAAGLLSTLGGAAAVAGAAQAALRSGGSGLPNPLLLMLSEWGKTYVFMLPAAAGGPSGAEGGSSSHLLATWQRSMGGSSASSDSAPASGFALAASGAGPGAASTLAVFSLREKDTGTKVEALCKLQQYDTAALVAAAAGFGRDNIAEIHRKHGDYLWAKAEFDQAITQYVKTMGSLEPSYVIRRFLDSQRIANLAAYLEALHAAGGATSDHTTLLINCYTKLRQTDKLRAFIQGSGPAASGGEGAGPSGAAAAKPLQFDVRAAISVLRDAGVWAEALLLAEKHNEHDWYLQIQLDAAAAADVTGAAGAASPSAAAAASAAPAAAPGAAASASAARGPQALTAAAAAAAATSSTAAGPGGSAAAGGGSSGSSGAPSGVGAAAALSYLRRLPFTDAETYARKYGRALLAADADATTELVVDLCTRWDKARRTPFLPPSGAGHAPAAAAQAAVPHSSASALRVRSDDPESFALLFADRPLHLKRFLAALVRRAAAGDCPVPSQPLWMTLLEVSLRRDVTRAELAMAAAAAARAGTLDALKASAAEAEGGGGRTPAAAAASNAAPDPVTEADVDARVNEDVLLGVLRNPAANYDAQGALRLCQVSECKAGCLYLYERLQLYPLVISHFAAEADRARARGAWAEFRAARRELIKRAKQYTGGLVGGSGGGVGAAGSGAGAGSGASGAGMGGGAASAAAAGATTGSGVQDAATATALWVDVLRFLAKTYGAGPAAASAAPAAASSAALASTRPAGIKAPGADDSEALLTDVLRAIEAQGSVPPLVLLSALGTSPVIPFGVVRDFVVRALAADADKAAEDAAVVASLHGDMSNTLCELHRLTTQPVVFQSRRCRTCGGELDLPSVYFVCGAPLGEEHAFHVHCVEASGGGGGSGSGGLGAPEASLAGGGGPLLLECPICAPSQRQVRDIRAALSRSAAGLATGGYDALEARFATEVAAAPDGFYKIVDYLSKGVMMNTTGSGMPTL